MKNLDFINKVPIFAGLKDQELTDLARKLNERVFAKGMIIFHKGSLGQYLYIVRSGGVRIFINSISGQQMSLNHFGPGECFGEISMIDGQL